MKKLIIIFTAVIFTTALLVFSSEYTQAQSTTIEVDEDPGQDGRVFSDITFMGVRYIGCHSSGGNCTATVVVEETIQP